MDIDGTASLEVPAQRDRLDEVLDFLQAVTVEARFSEALAVRFTTAGMEVVGNIVAHGAASGATRVSVTVTTVAGCLRAVVRDDGPPLAVDLDAVQMPAGSADRGRGLAMATALLDDFTYARQGGHNLWVLTVESAG